MTIRKYLLAPALLLAGSVCACSETQEKLPESVSAVYADLLQYRHTSAGIDSLSYAAGIDSVLSAHDYDRASFYQTFSRVGGSAEEVTAFFDEVSGHLKPPDPPAPPQ